MAQRPAARLPGPIGAQGRTVLAGSRPPRALAANDVGELAGGTQIQGMTLVFNRTAAQQKALTTLLAAQQNPASPLYHQWLTPAQFGAQFGVADSDVAAVQAWLQGQGFSLGKVSPAQDRISFSGSAAQVNAAFGTSLHQYRTGTGVSYAPSTDLSLPTSLASMVTAVLHVNSFRPHSMVKVVQPGMKPAYTTATTQEHFLTPGDVATQYDVAPTYHTGFDGSGQTVAVAGESFIQLSDVQNFQNVTGEKANLPTLVLEPGTGGSASYAGDEFESDIDVEYATSMAPGANVLLVYVGDSPNYSAFDSFDYAIEENLAPVVSLSYGTCEGQLDSSYALAGNQLFQQAAAQGQTLISAAGDEGSTECFGYTDSNNNPLPAAEQQALSINYPSDSPYVTAIGGLQMQAGTYESGNSQYWQTAGSTSVPSSLLSYVPETVWNEDSTNFGLASGGGGASTIFTGPNLGPTYQTGVAGLPAGNLTRFNPDISLQASVVSPGYLACSSDPSAFLPGQTSSCVDGIYDQTGKYVTEAGGTSFGAPIFAGMMAVLNQAKHGTGQGAVNATLYGLAGNAATYSSVFHDTTQGNNDCAILGAQYCSGGGLTMYAAGGGYDEASGLGSIDFTNLVSAWPATAATALTSTSVQLSPATTTPAAGASDVIAIQVNAAGGGTPTGTVQVSLANESVPNTNTTISTTPGATAVAPLTLNNGQVSYTFPGTAIPGTQVITVSYSGDATHAASTATLALTVANTLIPTGGFTFSVGNLSVAANKYATSTITITPSGGYNGLINFSIPTLPSTDCYATDYSGITSASPVQINLYIGTGTECTSNAAVRIGNKVVTFRKNAPRTTTTAMRTDRKPELLSLAGLLAFGLVLPWRKRRMPALTVALLGALTLVAGMGLSGCGGAAQGTSTGSGGSGTGGSGGTGSSAVTLTLVGTDSVSANITSSAQFTLTTAVSVP